MRPTLVVVLNWNGIDDTERCLDALAEQSVKHTVFVVENGSSDGSAARLAARSNVTEKVIVHLEPANLGFAGGVNIGINYAIANGYSHVALLNNDACPDPQWLENLHHEMDASGAAIVTGLMVQERAVENVPFDAGADLIDTAGDALSIWGMPFPSMRGLSVLDAPERGAVFSASGGASLFRTDVFETIGDFDEDFFAYFEDVDVSFRARLAGFQVAYTPDATVRHKIGATSSKIPGFTVYQTFKNLPMLLVKNIPTGLRFRVGSRFSLLYLMMLLKAIATGNGRPALKGVLATVRLLPRTLRKRRRIQQTRTISASTVDALLVKDLPPGQHGMRRLLSFGRTSPRSS